MGAVAVTIPVVYLYRMRYLLPLALVLCAAHGAQEVFTLDDGRTLTGEYDDADQRLYTTINGKTQALLIANDQIVERVPVGTKKPLAPLPAKGAVVSAPIIGPAVTAEAPKPMTPEEKKVADAAYALALLRRESDKLLAESAKAARDAVETRSDAERKRVEARLHRAKFKKRMEFEPASEPWTDETLLTTLYILPRTSGNNRATVEAWARAGQLEAKALALDATALRKRSEAADAARGRSND